jgi:hypothetical protein
MNFPLTIHRWKILRMLPSLCKNSKRLRINIAPALEWKLGHTVEADSGLPEKILKNHCYAGLLWPIVGV